MDPVIDLDRELARSTQVDPSPDFTARVRARLAEQPRPSRWGLPRLALAATTAVAIGIVAASVGSRPSNSRVPSTPARLEHHDLAVVVPLRSALPSRPPLQQRTVSHMAARMAEVAVSRSEMLALQQLFSGLLVAPPAGAIASELSIQALAIDAISLPTILEGDKQ